MYSHSFMNLNDDYQSPYFQREIEEGVEGQFSDAEDDTSVIPNDKKPNEIVEVDEDDFENFDGHYEDDSDFYESDEYDDWNDHSVDGRNRVSVVSIGGQHPNRQTSTQAKVTKFQPSEKVFTKYSEKINVNKYEGPKLSGSAVNKVIEQEKRDQRER